MQPNLFIKYLLMSTVFYITTEVQIIFRQKLCVLVLHLGRVKDHLYLIWHCRFTCSRYLGTYVVVFFVSQRSAR